MRFDKKNLHIFYRFIFLLATATLYAHAAPTQQPNAIQGAASGLLVAQFFQQEWLENLVYSRYDTYPYAHGDAYLYPSFTTEQSEPQELRTWRFAAETGMFFAPQGNRLGSETRVEGFVLFPGAGPVLEHVIYTALPSEGIAGTARLGVQFPLMNTNILAVHVIAQWVLCYGGATGNSGMNLGLTLRSYPLRPLLLEWRTQWRFLHENGTEYFSNGAIWESHLEAGIMLNSPLELYAAWKYIRDRYTRYSGHAAAVGVKYHL